jgi:hypothetical protein
MPLLSGSVNTAIVKSRSRRPGRSVEKERILVFLKSIFPVFSPAPFGRRSRWGGKPRIRSRFGGEVTSITFAQLSVAYPASRWQRKAV